MTSEQYQNNLIQQQKDHAEEVKKLLDYLLAPVLLSKACKYDLAPGGWLSIEYQAPLNNQPETEQEYKYYLLFAANIHEMTSQQIQNKLFVMLFDRLRSLKQDINGLFLDYNLTRK